jgi:hypothetical protein
MDHALGMDHEPDDQAPAVISLVLGVALAVIGAVLLGLCYYALVAIGQATASL